MRMTPGVTLASLTLILILNAWPLTGPLLAGEPGSGWRMAQMERLSPEERARVKKNYEEFKKLPPEEKNRLKQNYQQFKQAPPEERERLRQNYKRFENMTPEEHRQMERNLGIDRKK
ncbi:MAG: DUF3106 domain-containing protein [Nitrospiria bacterium]